MFQPILIGILKKNGERSFRRKNSQTYSPFSHWDFFTDLSYRCVATTFCAVVFLVSMKCVLIANQNDGLWKTFLVWLGGIPGADGYLCSASPYTPGPVTMGGTKWNPGLEHNMRHQSFLNPSTGMFLMLCGDIELNPGPTTNDLIKEMGISLGSRMDTFSLEMQSLSTTLSAMASQVSVIVEQLQKKEEDIKLIQEQTERIEERLLKLEDEREKQQILFRQDNIIFYGIPEPVNKHESEDCVVILIQLLNLHDTARTWREVDIARAHRLGKKEDVQTRPRPVMARLVRSRDKRCLIASKASRSGLYKEGIKMNDDLTTAQRDRLKTLKENGYTAFYRGTQLFSKPRKQTSERHVSSEKTQNSANDRVNHADVVNQNILSTEEYPPLPTAHHLCPSDSFPDHSLLTLSQDTDRNRQNSSCSSSGGRGRGRAACSAGGSSDSHGASRGFGRGRPDPESRSQGRPQNSVATTFTDAELENDASPDLRPRTRNMTKPTTDRRKGVSAPSQLPQGRIDVMMRKTSQQQ